MLEIFKASGLGNIAGGTMEIMEKTPIHQPAWYFIYLFTLIGLFAWTRLYYGNILVQTVQASINFRVSNKMFKDNSLLQNQLDLLLYLFYFLSMSFLLYYIELRIDLRPYLLQGGLLLLFNLAFLAGLFLARIMLLNITGILFKRVGIAREYLYNSFIFNKLSGLSMLPLIFLLVYTSGLVQKIVFILTVFVLAGTVVMRLIRGVVFSYKKEVLVFYMFLYLCALEIAPLVLLYRWLEGIL